MNSKFVSADEEKCYTCGRTNDELLNLKINQLFLTPLKNEMEQCTSELVYQIQQVNKDLELYTKENIEPYLLEFPVQSLKTNLKSFSIKVPYLNEIIKFNNSKSQTLAEIIENLINLKSILKNISEEPLNAEKILQINSTEDNSHNKNEYYFENILGKTSVFQEKRVLKDISNLIYKIWECKYKIDTIENMHSIDEVQKLLQPELNEYELDIIDVFPKLESFYDNNKEKKTSKWDSSSFCQYNYYFSRSRNIESTDLKMKVLLCPICSAIFYKYGEAAANDIPNYG